MKTLRKWLADPFAPWATFILLAPAVLLAFLAGPLYALAFVAGLVWVVACASVSP